MIQLVGPGGAGKTTVGLALANRMGIPFIDLDEQFRVRIGDISDWLELHGYASYANRNVQLYLDILGAFTDTAVLALSSGFMTYALDAHPDYGTICRDIVSSPSTLVLLPSFDYETCVTETVRRQLNRPFSRSAQREEQVIRARFKIFSALPTKKCETTMPINLLVDQLMAQLPPNSSLQPTEAT
jgi:shikimate kinase